MAQSAMRRGQPTPVETRRKMTASQQKAKRELSYVSDDDIDRLAIAERNRVTLLAQGVSPREVAHILKDSPLTLCPYCARPRRRSRKTCARDECVAAVKGAALRGTHRSAETRARISAGSLASPKRHAQWEAMKGRRLPGWWRAAIAKGVREHWHRQNGTSAA